MISKKNIYSLQKTRNFLKEYPIVLIYQHNNLTVQQRIDLKVQLQKHHNIKTLTVKNSIVEKVCSPCFFSFFVNTKEDVKKKSMTNGTNTKQLQNLLQGPVFLLGCHKLEELKNIWDILKTSSSFVFLGSQFNNQIYTHLDIQKSLEINNNIYYDFFNIIYQHLNFQNSVVYNTVFSFFDVELSTFNYSHKNSKLKNMFI